MLSNSMFLPPSQTHPNMFKIHNVCQTLYNLVVDFVHIIFIPNIFVCFTTSNIPSLSQIDSILVVLFLFVHFVCFPYPFLISHLHHRRLAPLLPKVRRHAQSLARLRENSEVKIPVWKKYVSMGDAPRMIFPVDEMNHN